MQTPAALQQPTSPVASPLLKEVAGPSRALTDHPLLLPPHTMLLLKRFDHGSGSLGQAVGNKV